ncbi:MlaE family ABC transporter permease [Acidobacteriota bacterium]
MGSDEKKTISLPENLSFEFISGLLSEIKSTGIQRSLVIDFSNLQECDQSGLVFLNYLKKNYPNITFLHLQDKFESMLSDQSLVGRIQFPPLKRSTLRKKFGSFGDGFLSFLQNVQQFFSLLTDEIFYTFQYLWKRKGLYPGEIGNQLYVMGYKSLGIVSLITFLVGVTISLTSAAQLKLFGADIYLAYFIGFAMVRELVPLMIGIILAGKVGAAMTAEISTMKVLEEIDALKTMGVIPEKFLLVPRLIAMTLAIPLLVGVADFVGIFGGVLVARFFLGTPISAFFREMFNIVHIEDFLIGLFKTMTFGWTIVLCSGFKGLSVKHGPEEVGRATTESVVLSITLIILLGCVFALIFY